MSMRQNNIVYIINKTVFLPVIAGEILAIAISLPDDNNAFFINTHSLGNSNS